MQNIRGREGGPSLAAKANTSCCGVGSAAHSPITITTKRTRNNPTEKQTVRKRTPNQTLLLECELSDADLRVREPGKAEVIISTKQEAMEAIVNQTKVARKLQFHNEETIAGSESVVL